MRTLVSLMGLSAFLASSFLFVGEARGLRGRTGDGHVSGSIQRDDAEPDAIEAEPYDAFAAHLAGGRTTRGMVAHRELHFTFDDGPRLDTTPVLLDRLDALGVRATFFLVTRGFDGASDVDRAKAALAQDIVRRGHLGRTHPHAPRSDDALARRAA